MKEVIVINPQLIEDSFKNSLIEAGKILYNVTPWWFWVFIGMMIILNWFLPKRKRGR